MSITGNAPYLTGGTLYYCQIQASNSAGTSSGGINSFTTPSTVSAPAVTTGAATSVTSSSASLNGTVNPNGAATSFWFLYGTDSSLVGASKTAIYSIASGTSTASISGNATGLTFNTRYYYQLQASNSAGTSSGGINSFTTPSTALLETVSAPATPAGPAKGTPGTSYSYSTGGATDNLGNPVQYQFNWGDGSSPVWLPVGTTSASHSWSTGTYNVTAQARSATNNSVVSSASGALAVNITSASVQLVSALMSNSEPTGSGCTAPPSVTAFATTDTLMEVWFLVEGAQTGDQPVANWYAPNGSLYTTSTWSPLTAPSGENCFWSWINIAGDTPAMEPGTWTVTVYWNNVQLTSLTFTIGALSFVPMTPCRVADTRYSNGDFGSPSLTGGGTRSFTVPSSSCGVPSTAAAYSLNVTVVPPGPLDYITVWPSGDAQPVVSTLNSVDGRIKANAAIIPAGAGGAVSVYATNPTDVILDIDGYFVPAGSNVSALAFYPLTPCRVADTRYSSYGSLGPPSLSAGQGRSFAVLSSACNVPSTAQAYSLNFTVVPPGTVPVNYITTYPTGATQPLASTLNDDTGTIVANAAIVPAGTGGAVSVYSYSNTNLLIDINGYFAPPGTGGLSLYNLTPCRVLDSRVPTPTTPPFTGEKDVNVTGSGCGAPSSAQAYVFNATVVPPGPMNYLTLWPQGGTMPVVSTLNAMDGAITSNMALVPTTNGSISSYVYVPSTTYLILDIFGYFAP